MSDGKPLRDDATYTLVFTNFLLGGGDGLGLSNDAIRTESLNKVDLDALVDYVRAQRQPLRVPFVARLTAALP
jgi:hypothetical protein